MMENDENIFGKEKAEINVWAWKVYDQTRIIGRIWKTHKMFDNKLVHEGRTHVRKILVLENIWKQFSMQIEAYH